MNAKFFWGRLKSIMYTRQGDRLKSGMVDHIYQEEDGHQSYWNEAKIVDTEG